MEFYPVQPILGAGDFMQPIAFTCSEIAKVKKFSVSFFKNAVLLMMSYDNVKDILKKAKEINPIMEKERDKLTVKENKLFTTYQNWQDKYIKEPYSLDNFIKTVMPHISRDKRKQMKSLSEGEKISMLFEAMFETFLKEHSV